MCGDVLRAVAMMGRAMTSGERFALGSMFAGCMVFGQSLQARQGSLQSGINQPGTAEGAPRRGDAD